MNKEQIRQFLIEKGWINKNSNDSKSNELINDFYESGQVIDSMYKDQIDELKSENNKLKDKIMDLTDISNKP